MHSLRRRLRRDERGLSEIVGTLMLIIIVVTAATLLAAFVATYQAQLQKQESFSHDQSLESIHILGIQSHLNGSKYSNLNFTLASASVNPSIILGITINQQVIGNFTWWNYTTHSEGSYECCQNFILNPFQFVNITLNLSPKSPLFSFLGTASVPLPNQYLTFNIYTDYQNDFTRSFLPPVPLETVSWINQTGAPGILLDGTSSFQPGGNATIVQWEWTVVNTNSSKPAVGALYGEEAEFPADLLSSRDSYNVTLMVTNNFGLIGTTNLTYQPP